MARGKRLSLFKGSRVSMKSSTTEESGRSTLVSSGAGSEMDGSANPELADAFPPEPEEFHFENTRFKEPEEEKRHEPAPAASKRPSLENSTADFLAVLEFAGDRPDTVDEEDEMAQQFDKFMEKRRRRRSSRKPRSQCSEDGDGAVGSPKSGNTLFGRRRGKKAATQE